MFQKGDTVQVHPRVPTIRQLSYAETVVTVYSTGSTADGQVTAAPTDSTGYLYVCDAGVLSRESWLDEYHPVLDSNGPTDG